MAENKAIMDPQDEGKTFGRGEFSYDDPNLIQFIQRRADENDTTYQEELMKFVDEVESFYRNMADGGAVKPNHPLNRKMFQEPIRAQAGTYVPTIEQIMTFYQGGFDDTGMPLNSEQFLQALEAAKLTGQQGLFPNEGQGFGVGLTGINFGDKIFSDQKEDQIKAIAEQLDVPLSATRGAAFGQDQGILSGLNLPEGDAFQTLIDQSIAEDQAGQEAAAATRAEAAQEETEARFPAEQIADQEGISALTGAPKEEATATSSEPIPLSEQLEKDSQQIIDVFDSINSKQGGEDFTEGFKSTNKRLLFSSLRALNAAKETGGQALQEAMDFTKGIIANIAPNEESVNDFNKAFETLTGFNLSESVEDVKGTDFSPDSAALKAGEFIQEKGGALIGAVTDSVTDDKGNLINPITKFNSMIEDIKTGYQGAIDENERNKRVLATDYGSLNEADQKLKEDLETNPAAASIIGAVDSVKNTINGAKESLNTAADNMNVSETVKNETKNEMEKIQNDMDFILDQYEKGDITKDKFNDLMNAENNKLNELQSKVESQTSSVPTGEISTEDADTTDKVEKEIDSGTGSQPDGTATDTTGKEIVAGTTAESGVSGAIARALEASGFNLGYEKDPDSDALKAVYYGLQLFQTPGEPLDAAAKVASDYFRNEINEKYKTKAAQQKFRGEIFKTLLSGEMDLLKEQIKAGNKINKQSKYSIGSLKENAPTILSSIANKTNLSFDSKALEDPNTLESLYVTDIYNKMQEGANKAYNAGEEIPSLNQLALDSIDTVNNQFLFKEKKGGFFEKILGYLPFVDAPVSGQTELAGVKQQSGTGQKVTNEQIDALVRSSNLPREEVIKIFKTQRPDLDFSGVS